MASIKQLAEKWSCVRNDLSKARERAKSARGRRLPPAAFFHSCFGKPL
jgi:hypothetical protein